MQLRILASAVLILAMGIENIYALFPDIENSFYRDSVQILSDEGVISGFADGTFGPEKTITRAEILKVLLKTK